MRRYAAAPPAGAASAGSASSENKYFPQTLLAELAREAGQFPALRFGSEELSYAKLFAQVKKMAAYLANRISPNEVVGVYLPRGFSPIVAQLALWEIGAVYLPLDPDRDTAKREMVLASGMVACICLLSNEFPQKGNQSQRNEEALPAAYSEIYNRNLAEFLDNFSPPSRGRSLSIINFNDAVNWAESLSPPKALEPELSRLAYGIFSSGSTGAPKGIPIRFHGLDYWIKVLGKWFMDKKVTGVLACTSIEFDPSVWELVMALVAKAPLVIASEDDLKDVNKLKELVKKVSDMTLVPSAIEQLTHYLNELREAGLKRIYTTGESCSKRIAKACVDAGIELINCYGPTESTFGVSMGPLRPEDYEGEIAPINEPEPPVQLKIVVKEGERYRKAAIGEEGQIFIVAGDNLTPHYWGEVDEKTRGRIIPLIKIGEGGEEYEYENVFNTGDLGKRAANGKIYYQGRCDNLIKVQGVLVNPETVRNYTLSYPGIEDALCVVDESFKSPILTICIKMKGGASPPSMEQLVAHMTTRSEKVIPLIPEAVPQRLEVWLEPWPTLEASGKVNRRAIAEKLKRLTANCYRQPRTHLEQQLVRLWLWFFHMKEFCPGRYPQNEMKTLRAEWVLEAKYPDFWSTVSEENKNLPYRVGRGHSFSAMGGKSANTVELCQIVEEVYKIEKLPLENLFPLHSLTPESLSYVLYPLLAAIQRRKGIGASNLPIASPPKVGTSLSPVPSSGSGVPELMLTPFLNLFCFYDVTGTLAWRSAISVPGHHVVDIPCLSLQNEQLACLSLKLLAHDYAQEILQIQPHGPYILKGYSLGATLAYAVAQLLEEHNQRVKLLIIDGLQPELINKNPTFFAKELVRLMAKLTEVGAYPWKVKDFQPLINFAQNNAQQAELANHLAQFKPEEQVAKLEFSTPDIKPEWRVTLENLYLLATADLGPPLKTTEVVVYSTKDTRQRLTAYGAEDEVAYTLGWTQTTRTTIANKPYGGDHFSVVRNPQALILAAQIGNDIAPYLPEYEQIQKLADLQDKVDRGGIDAIIEALKSWQPVIAPTPYPPVAQTPSRPKTSSASGTPLTSKEEFVLRIAEIANEQVKLAAESKNLIKRLADMEKITLPVRSSLTRLHRSGGAGAANEPAATSSNQMPEARHSYEDVTENRQSPRTRFFSPSPSSSSSSSAPPGQPSSSLRPEPGS